MSYIVAYADNFLGNTTTPNSLTAPVLVTTNFRMARMVNPITAVSVSQTVPPQPATLQKTGAFISLGATNLATGNIQLITQVSDLTPLLNSNPDAVRLKTDVANFFAQGAGLSVYVIETGFVTTTSAISMLTSWIAENPGIIYSYLCPPSFDSDASLPTLLNMYLNLGSQTYFFITTTTLTYTRYTAMKDVMWMVNAPGALEPSSIVGMFWQWLNNSPSSTGKVPSMNLRYMYGLTPWPVLGNSSVLQSIYSAGGNYLVSGAEGGLSNTMVRGGYTADKQQANFWYAIDWVQENLDLAVSNAVINGSNNTLNPLEYNQNGINTLQSVAVQIMQNAQTYALSLGNLITTQLSSNDFIVAYNAGTFLGATVVNAEPFLAYGSENPLHYKIGQYNGISIIFTPQLGFEQIVINVNATEVV